MHDTTRIAICRWGFLLLCVVPTLLTGGFIAHHWLTLRSPAAKAEWERELSQRLGLAVSIESLSYPQPDVAELSVVKLSDAETGELLAECRRVEIVPPGERWEIALVEPMIRRESLSLVAHRLHERLLASGGAAPSLRATAAHVTIQGQTGSDSLVNFAWALESTGSTPVCTIRGSLPQQTEPIGFRIARSRQVSPPATQVEWNCPTPVPARLLAAFLDGTQSLGDSAAIMGKGSVTIAKSGVSGELAGEISGIDLTAAISQRFPHRLSGKATLTIERGTIDRGRLIEARGALVALHGGRISRSLLQAAEEHLLLTAQLSADEADSVHYQHLAIGFHLTGDHLRLAGVADERQPGVLIASESGPLLAAPSGHEAPAVALARALLPDSQVQVPAAMQTAALLKLLPPASAELPRTASHASHTPTRLGPPPPAILPSNPIRERSLR